MAQGASSLRGLARLRASVQGPDLVWSQVTRLQPMIFIRGEARPDRKGKLLEVVASASGVPTVRLDKTNHGYEILRKMGWEENTPLGLRKVGIVEPVETRGRVGKDTSGLGYEKYVPTEGEKKVVTLKIVTAGEKYGVGKCELGSVFIPGGSMKFIRTLGFQRPPCNDRILSKIAVYGVVVARKAKHDWRLEKVDTLFQY